MRLAVLGLSALALLCAAPAQAAETYVRVVDVGPSLCVIARTPGGSTMLYDAGDEDTHCQDAVRELVPDGEIDLLVISHLHEDNIGELEAILSQNRVAQILYPGEEREGDKDDRARQSIDVEGATVTNLSSTPLPFGHVFDLGDARATFIAGWADGTNVRVEGDPQNDEDDALALLSIVMRLEFGGRSVLLMSTSYGNGTAGRCGYAQGVMVANAANVPIDSDVVVTETRLTRCFVREVTPGHVIFSRQSDGPTGADRLQGTIQTLRQEGVPTAGILRTDRNISPRPPMMGVDAEGRAIAGTAPPRCRDRAGDDDVEIWLPDDGPVRVAYSNDNAGC